MCLRSCGKPMTEFRRESWFPFLNAVETHMVQLGAKRSGLPYCVLPIQTPSLLLEDTEDNYVVWPAKLSYSVCNHRHITRAALLLHLGQKRESRNAGMFLLGHSSAIAWHQETTSAVQPASSTQKWRLGSSGWCIWLSMYRRWKEP